MNFQTPVSLVKQEHNQIKYQSKVLLVGSCFSENMGNKLHYYKFQSTQNPFGILFHPKAIENLIVKSIRKEKYTDNDVFFHNERWHCFDAHSSLSSLNKDDLLNNLNLGIKHTLNQLQNATHIIITLGTSWVYREQTNNTIVANCHKIPQKNFLKELISVNDILKSLKTIKSMITSVNAEATIIFTVSPVRHSKDGFIENQRSKSHLITAIHQIVAPKNNVYYFPSYEIMMDELRDYRFYNEDMLHPNKTAVNYIWEKFKDVWIDKNSQSIMKDVETIQKGLDHRPFNPASEAHQLFLKKLQQKKETLKQAFPFMNF